MNSKFFYIFATIIKALIIMVFLLEVAIMRFQIPWRVSGEGPVLLESKDAITGETKTSEIEGMKIYRVRDALPPFFCHLYLFGTRGIYYVYHLMYEDVNGMRSIVTYKFRYTTGISAIIEGSDMTLVIEDTPDSIVFWYDKVPEGEFIIEHNPFSKKILFKYINEAKLDEK